MKQISSWLEQLLLKQISIYSEVFSNTCTCLFELFVNEKSYSNGNINDRKNGTTIKNRFILF